MVRALDLNGADGAPSGFRSPMRASAAQTAIAWVMGGFATIGVVVLGSVLALVFAATLAFVLVVAAAVLVFLAVAWRVRRPRAIGAPVGGSVIEARKVGHSWVAYGWDQPS